jgi:hypothetical protein
MYVHARVTFPAFREMLLARLKTGGFGEGFNA